MLLVDLIDIRIRWLSNPNARVDEYHSKFLGFVETMKAFQFGSTG